jgi:hypothetical protein
MQYRTIESIKLDFLANPNPKQIKLLTETLSFDQIL